MTNTIGAITMKMTSRMLPDQIDEIKFRTALKTQNEEYAADVMPIDLKADGFIEDYTHSAKEALKRFVERADQIS